MEQRPLRLGDILDDYCPRERRVTNHAIVAIVDEDVKQTRCTTCDAEHTYKGGKAPRRRKGDSTSRLYKEVLAGITDEAPNAEPAPVEMPSTEEPPPVQPQHAAPADEARSAEERSDETRTDAEDEGPLHRPLIRATLPRPEGVKVERQIPEFTIRQNGRNGNFRDARGKGRGPGGHGAHQGHHRFGRGPHGRTGPGGGQRHGGGPRKRGR
jgi:hypothetical protein